MIHAKGQADVNVDVKITRHGPIITDFLRGETRQVALGWTLYDGLHMRRFSMSMPRRTGKNSARRLQLDAPGQMSFKCRR